MSSGVKNSGARVRSLEHADPPGGGERAAHRGDRAGRRRPASVGRSRSTSPARRARPPWPPNPPRVKVDALPRYAGTSRPPATSDVGAQPGGRWRAERQDAARRRRRPAPSSGTGSPSRVTGAVGAGQADRRRGGEAQRRAGQRALQARRALGVAEGAVAEPEREVVHRPRRRHADLPEPDAAGPVLDRGQRAGVEDLDRAAVGS